MTRLRRIEGARERMDAPDVDPRQLRRALRDVARVNRWLGGTRALLRHAGPALPPGGGRVLDVGTGSGDLPAALDRWARRHRRHVSITAVDLHAATIAVARERLAEMPDLRLARADGLCLPFADGTFDLAMLSMTLHHMEGAAQTAILAELGRVARGGRVLVGELERALPNYIGARLMAATVWRRSQVTRHDGPLSVLRSFTPAELLDLARRAGLRRPEVHRHPFYRLVLLADSPSHERTR